MLRGGGTAFLVEIYGMYEASLLFQKRSDIRPAEELACRGGVRGLNCSSAITLGGPALQPSKYRDSMRGANVSRSAVNHQ